MLNDQFITNRLLELKPHEQDVIFINGRPFVIAPATEDDIERISKGVICMD
jgi:hypothetical protein